MIYECYYPIVLVRLLGGAAHIFNKQGYHYWCANTEMENSKASDICMVNTMSKVVYQCVIKP